MSAARIKTQKTQKISTEISYKWCYPFMSCLFNNSVYWLPKVGFLVVVFQFYCPCSSYLSIEIHRNRLQIGINRISLAKLCKNMSTLLIQAYFQDSRLKTFNIMHFFEALKITGSPISWKFKNKRNTWFILLLVCLYSLEIAQNHSDLPRNYTQWIKTQGAR